MKTLVLNTAMPDEQCSMTVTYKYEAFNKVQWDSPQI